MDYNSLNNLNDSDKFSLTSVFQGILTSLKHISVNFPFIETKRLTVFCNDKCMNILMESKQT